MSQRKILFLGETYRADAITWMNGLKEFGNFEIITWELKNDNHTFFSHFKRLLELSTSLFQLKKIIKLQQPHMIIAERTTSYGFLAALLQFKPIAIAQQGCTDLWPEKSVLLALKKMTQNYAFEKADLIHAWGPVMTIAMQKENVDMRKVLVVPKGIDLQKFDNNNTASDKISAIVTRSLMPEYSHDVILKAFGIVHKKGIDFDLIIVGDGTQLPILKELTKELNIEDKVRFTGRIQNTILPKLLQQSNIYISMPITEGVSASLFEAMACNCYPIVSDIPGNQSWIKHGQNGVLIPINDYKTLANELILIIQNKDKRIRATEQNRKFVEENANYHINMKIIAEAYHKLINTAKNN
jgi:glycosyltransferase involved in cell wall biosynthesis